MAKKLIKESGSSKGNVSKTVRLKTVGKVKNYNSYVEVELKDKKFAFGSNKIYKIFDKIVSNKEVYDFYKQKGFTVIESKIKIEPLTGFNRDIFIEKLDEICKEKFNSNLESKDVIFSFDKKNFNVFPFDFKLKNGKKVNALCADGVIIVESFN
jgi:hypothetical protein